MENKGDGSSDWIETERGRDCGRVEAEVVGDRDWVEIHQGGTVIGQKLRGNGQ